MRQQPSNPGYCAGTDAKYPQINPVAVVALRRFRAECLEQSFDTSHAMCQIPAAVDTLLTYDEAMKTRGTKP